MHATVILNENAGSAGEFDTEQAARALRAAGYRAEARVTASLNELDEVLDDTEGLVVCVGGDGTLRATVLRLRARDRPLALVPMGTANNVAAALGVDREGDAYDMLARLAEPRRCAFDLGRATSAAGESLFLEACGFGLYAALLDTYRPERGKDVLRAIDAVQDVVFDFRPFELVVEADGERFEGPFVLATVMNTHRMGLRLTLAPDADPCDGALDLVLIRHEDGHSLLEYGSRLLRGTLEEAVNVIRIPVERCRISGRDSRFHLDDEVHRPEGAGAAVIIDVLKSAVEMWLPADAGA